MILSFKGTRELTNPFGVYDPEAYANYPGQKHPGTDWYMPEGTELYAGMNGIVTAIDRNPTLKTGRGKEVQITFANLQRNTCHMKSITVKSGDFVKEGQLIGYSGNTGYSSGPHLHDELLVNGVYTDLEEYLKKEDTVIPTRDLLNALFYCFRGRLADNNEAGLYVGKISYNDLIPILNTGEEHDKWIAGLERARGLTVELESVLKKYK